MIFSLWNSSGGLKFGCLVPWCKSCLSLFSFPGVSGYCRPCRRRQSKELRQLQRDRADETTIEECRKDLLSLKNEFTRLSARPPEVPINPPRPRPPEGASKLGAGEGSVVSSTLEDTEPCPVEAMEEGIGARVSRLSRLGHL